MTAPRTVSVATGAASYSMIAAMAKKLEKLIPGLKINVIEIKNRFFGESITVSGLLTGRDICEQLTGLVLGDALIVPGNALRHPEEDFLCGMKLTELEEKLGVPTSATGGSGYEFLEALLGVQ